MFSETNELVFSLPVILWSVLAVGVGLFCGFMLGRLYTLYKEPRRLKADREKTLKTLMSILESTDQLSSDLDTHNTEVDQVRRSVSDIPDSGYDTIQETLMNHITEVVKSNRRLENDLVMTRYKLEENAQELDRTRTEARTDQLSGLANRKSFEETLSFMISKFEKSHNSPFALILCDVDHFKRINDTFGHIVGDEVVQRMGLVLKDCVRPRDHVARIGGDEFAILLANVNFDRAQSVAARIRGTVELTNFDAGDRLSKTSITISMGMAVIRPGDDRQSFFDRADKALYRSKERGRNQLHVCDETGNLVPV